MSCVEPAVAFASSRASKSYLIVRRESLSEDFKPQKYHDTFQENLKALIEAKRKGKTIVEEAPPKRASVIDMMEALKRSLRAAEAQKRKKPMRARPAARERERRRLAS